MGMDKPEPPEGAKTRIEIADAIGISRDYAKEKIRRAVAEGRMKQAGLRGRQMTYIPI